jgi:flagellar biosynthesis/type III secretory pathway M-ring protein FliF/YscJ
MDFEKILENKPLLYGIIGGVVLLLALFITIGVVSSNGNSKNGQTVSEEAIKEDVDLLTTDNLGKAIEIQALLARYNIAVSRSLDGTKSRLYLKKGDCTTGMKKCTTAQRDEALIQIVQSGLMDQNVGLEIFDKGDFTSTKEDKKIRLTRAVNGELSRLIRKIKPIENASVFISIPEQTMFTSQQKPITATVQIVIPSGEKLEPLKVKAISNLLLGSVSGLEAENISITDTNGNVYHSIMNASDEMLARIEENDKYMQQKVMLQLDRLIGKGNYVATVSTFLRDNPAEKFSTMYDPDTKTSVNEQTFTEGLGDQTQDNSAGTNAVSVYLPNGMGNSSNNSSQNRSYSRSATETQYGVSRTQLNEYLKPGTIEEVTVAVTLERSALPPDTTLTELKELVASAAGPKVSADNVSIAFSDTVDPYLASGRPANLPKPDESGNPWWLAVALSAIGLFIVFRAVSGRVRQIQEENAIEVERLRQKEAEQDRELSDVNVRAAQLADRQSELAQGLLEQQQREYLGEKSEADMLAALQNLSANIAHTDGDLTGEGIKSWIENNG